MPSPFLFSFFSSSSPPTGELTSSSSSFTSSSTPSSPPSTGETTPPSSSSCSSSSSVPQEKSQPPPCQAFHRFTSSVLPPSLHKIFERQCLSSSSSSPLVSTSSPSSSQSSSFSPSSSSVPSAFSVVSSSPSKSGKSLPLEDCWQCRYTGVALFSGVSTAAFLRSYTAVRGSIDRKFFVAISTAFAFLGRLPSFTHTVDI